MKNEVIFGNVQSKKVVKKSAKAQKKFIKKFGDDRNEPYHLKLEQNEVLSELGTFNLAKSDSAKLQAPKNAVVIGNIRMGFGHYRISMAMCSCARALGYTPLWLDLNSFQDTTCGKMIEYQNSLYSMGSRWSQKYPIFNKLYWEPLNSEGFRQLSYNACDQKSAELMTRVFQDLDKDIPFVGTHVWPSQAAVHSGLKNVVNAIPDNWQMALHLAEGAVHTVQSPMSYLGYTTLRGMDKDKILKPIPEGELFEVGHYIDHELVSNLIADTEKRLLRVQKGKPLRFLLTIGGAGAQKELFVKIIKFLLPYIKKKQATLFLNAGDHKQVLEEICKEIKQLQNANKYESYEEIKSFAQNALENEVTGTHIFYSNDIFTAVYSTNLLMRASDVLVTKPSELAFYPIPKLMIKRVGGHEMWGAIHSSEVGDGTYECDKEEQALNMLKLMFENKSILKNMNDHILKNNQIGLYNGGYEVIKLATKTSDKI